MSSALDTAGAPSTQPTTRRKGFDATNFFGGSPLNRQSHLRSDTEYLSRAASNPQARYLVLDKLRIPLVRDGELAWLNSETVHSLVPADWEQPRVFLGVDENHVDENNESTPYWALDVTGIESITKELESRSYFWAEARPAAFKLSTKDAAIVAQARALVDWNTRRPFCPQCGSKTISKEAGYKRYCTKDDCKAHKGVQNYAYPRTDPVIIVCIINKEGNKVLLGRQKSWPAGMYSCIAGFIESGESLEEAVRREAWEETNVQVGRVAYHSSQPWPFPSQLMFGCMAQAISEDVKLEDKELDDARWYTKEQVVAALKAGSSRPDLTPPEDRDTSKLWMPPSYAIANTIVKAWALDGFQFAPDRPEESTGAAKM